MKAGFFDPYLDTIGGGERYALTLAEYLLGEGWRVDLFWKDLKIKTEIQSRLNLNLDKMNFIHTSKNILKRWRIGRTYDLFFWVSDGSIPFLFAKNNILHFQVPFQGTHGKSFLNHIKLKKINHVVCNSVFTKTFIDKEYDLNSEVIHPPVDTVSLKPQKKENLILSVGRFSQLLQAKRQDVLIDAFKKMVDQGLNDWKLVLAGGTDIGGREYFNQLKTQAESYPIEFLENPTFETIKDLYGKAKIFWSASGFGVDEHEDPQKVEHFGITTVEAMAGGCVPVVVDKGGSKEIIELKKTGFFWREEDELLKITSELISRQEVLKKMIPDMIKSSQRFSKKEFIKKFDEIIS